MLKGENFAYQETVSWSEESSKGPLVILGNIRKNLKVQFPVPGLLNPPQPLSPTTREFNPPSSSSFDQFDEDTIDMSQIIKPDVVSSVSEKSKSSSHSADSFHAVYDISESDFLGSLAERDSAQSTRVYPTAELRESAPSTRGGFDFSEDNTAGIGSKIGTETLFEDTLLANDIDVDSEWFKEKVAEKKKELLESRTEAADKARTMASSEASDVNIFAESIATSIHEEYNVQSPCPLCGASNGKMQKSDLHKWALGKAILMFSTNDIQKAKKMDELLASWARQSRN